MVIAAAQSAAQKAQTRRRREEGLNPVLYMPYKTTIIVHSIRPDVYQVPVGTCAPVVYIYKYIAALNRYRRFFTTPTLTCFVLHTPLSTPGSCCALCTLLCQWTADEELGGAPRNTTHP